MSQKDISLFYFASIDRPIFLEEHRFYVEEAKKRLLSQFSDVGIEEEAKQKEHNYYEWAGQHFNPDYHDEADVWERAHDEGIAHWIALTEMRNTVSLALTAGMFHKFDKALREKCILEFSHWLDYDVTKELVWDIGFPRLIKILEWIGMNITKKPYFRLLNACRLIVNVYKHGDGDAHRELSRDFPEYYHNFGHEIAEYLPLRYEQLEITEEHFIAFAAAIRDFWNDIPVHCMKSGLREEPDWLKGEIIKHQKRVDKRKANQP